MTKVVVNEDCGNSPKNIFAEKLTIAFAKGDTKFLLSSVTDDVRWNIVGEKIIEGKPSFAEGLTQLKQSKVAVVHIHQVVTHGQAGAANGTLTMNSGEIRAFCHVYEFNGAKATSVKEITSYVIEIT